MDLSKLCSGLFSDNLDIMGYRDQVVSALKPNQKHLMCWGPARTVKLEDTDDGDERISVGLGFIEQLKPGEILVVEGSQEFAYFGELMTRLSIRQKLGGAVIYGLTRDHIFTQDAPLPIFALGYSPKDIKLRGRVAATDVEVKLGNVTVSSGDYVFGDIDGVVVVPKKTKDSLIDKIHKDVLVEEEIKKMIENGADVKSILAFTKSF